MTTLEVPVFPLPQVVLFPGALLPLHVFEPRYRTMLADCLAADRRMAIAQIFDMRDVDVHGNPRIAEVAGVGEVVEHEALPDGRSNIVLRGLWRGRLEELPMSGPYRRARATSLVESDVRVTPTDAAALVAAVTSFTGAVERRDPTFAFRVPAELSTSALCDLAAQYLVADAEIRQSALEQLDVARRAEIVMRELAVQERMLHGETKGALH